MTDQHLRALCAACACALALSGCGGGGGRHNQSPTANDLTITTNEDTPQTASITASDPDGGRDIQALHQGQTQLWGAVGFKNGGGRDDWPCGPAGGTSPGLFRGLSGIAWWLLRLHDATIPSPLTMPVRG